MAELGHRPHRAARALRTGRSQSIGVVGPAMLATVGNTRMLESVSAAGSALGYALVVVSPAHRSGLAGASTTLRDQGVDGAIVLNEATALAPRRPRRPARSTSSWSTRCRTTRFAVVAVRSRGRRARGDGAPASARPRDRVGPRRQIGSFLRRRRARGRLARRARRGGDRRSPRGAGDWSAHIRSRRRARTGPALADASAASKRATTRWRSGLLRALARRGPRCAARAQRGGFRRRGGCRGLHAPADDRAAGLRHARPACRRGARRADRGRGCGRGGRKDSPPVFAPLLRDVVPTRLVVRENSGPAASVAL